MHPSASHPLRPSDDDGVTLSARRPRELMYALWNTRGLMRHARQTVRDRKKNAPLS